MPERIESGALKVIEVIGISPDNFEDAVQQAVVRAGAKLNNITGVEVKSFSAKVQENQLMEYHANVKIAFIVNMND